MKSLGNKCCELLLAAALARIATWAPVSSAQPAGGTETIHQVRIVQIEGVVEVSPRNATTWVPTTVTNLVLNPYDRVRTGPNSRMTLRWSDQSVMPVGALTELQILPPHEAKAESGLHLFRGILSFFHRDQPGRIRVITSGAQAGVEGTEFVLAVDTSGPTEITTMSVIDGTVRLYNNAGSQTLTNLQQAVVEPGKAPVLTAGFAVNNVLQWCFYYPAVLDLDELPLTKEEETALGESLKGYRAGDLLAALHNYPAGRQPASDAERLYYAALLLSVGQVEQTENALGPLSTASPDERIQRLATALRQMIAVVKRQANPSTVAPQLSTELLVASYYEQSLAHREASLERALDLARRAATNSPNFGFAWERVAELEFSFGRTDRALEALNRSLALSPRNAQAFALKGFLLAAENKVSEAIWWFEDALTLDPSLGNAWLGRGLCRIRRYNFIEGREDLLVAAAIEPQRALLRDYLGKAYAEEGDYPRASKELDIAKHLDKNDPTPWLYSALLNQQYNRINEAIRDLERSQDLNDNRSVYRSSLLLDQDEAVRSANLAAIYRDAGMFDVSVREASRAVTYDYANYSAHLFLANSYDQLRDPNLVNLRYETATESEYLVANLLAPVGAGALSPQISQQEYSKLFERDRFGLISSTEYLSRGAWTESGAQYGTFDNSSYSFEAFYRSDPGQRPNNDIEQRQLSLLVKQQFTPKDRLFVEVSHYQATGGDVFQRYDPATASLSFRTRETQEPILTVGYDHQWSPGAHTLVLFSRLDDRFFFTNQFQPTIVLDHVSSGIDQAEEISMAENYHGHLEIYSAEAQQIIQTYRHTTIAGARFQWGDIGAQAYHNYPSDLQAYFPDPPTYAPTQSSADQFDHLTLYLYHQWQIVDSFSLSGGLDFDWLKFPKNFLDAPLSPEEETVKKVSPKVGMIWTPLKNTVIRAAYTRSLSGASLDQSVRLEPVQVAGFLQSYRSVIPDSVAGATSGARDETFDVSLEQKLPSGTYLGVVGEILWSKVPRTRGAYDLFPEDPNFILAIPSGVHEDLDYRERSLTFVVNQLLGDELALTARYRVSEATESDNFPAVPPDAFLVNFAPQQQLRAVLQQVELDTVFNHRSGLFAQFQALWYSQSKTGFDPSEMPGDSFWQFNIFAGYRWPRRRGELTVGIENLTSQDYRLSPLNLYNELPRSRLFVMRLNLNF